MLKPRYRSLAEAVSEFNTLLSDLDVRHPKDPTIVESKKAAPAKPAKKQKPAPAKKQAVLEHAPQSRYTSNASAMDSFRMLAGLEQRVIMPWNPGLVGTTKYNNQMLAEAGLAQPASEPEDPEPAAAPQQQNHMAWGKKLSEKAKFKSYFFKHNRHEMPMDARIKAHGELAQHHHQTAQQLAQLSDSAMKRGDHQGSAALKDMQRTHHEISQLHSQKKHHRMFEAKVDEFEEDFE